MTIDQLQIDCAAEHLMRFLFYDQLKAAGQDMDYFATCKYCKHKEECLSIDAACNRTSQLLDPILKSATSYEGEVLLD